jgi:MFS superfamily sulfate permease-like transporter
MTTTARRQLARWLGPWVHEVNGQTLRADSQAGLLGAVLVLPQGIAFAALAGLPPAMGLVAAALPCAVAALAGSSRQVMTGPTNASSLALGGALFEQILREALKALIAREAARRLALFAGKEPGLKAPPRRRFPPDDVPG